MRKQLTHVIQLLSEGEAVDALVQSRLARNPESKVAAKTNEQKQILIDTLEIAEAFLSRRAVKTDDLPKWLPKQLDALATIIEQSDESKLEEVMKAISSFNDHRYQLLADILRFSTQSLTERLADGLDAAKELGVQSKRARTLASQIEDFEQKAKNSSQQIANTASNASSQVDDLKVTIADVRSKSKLAESSASTAALERDKAKEARRKAQEHANYSLSMREASTAIEQNLRDLHSAEKKSLGEHQKKRSEIELDLERTQKKARSILFEATTAALASEWASKRRNAQYIAVFWIIVLFVFVGFALTSSVFLVVPELFAKLLPDQYLDRVSVGNGSFEHSMLTKLFIVPPLLFGIWFAAGQYSHTRDRQLEFGKREALAKTLESYQIYLKGLAPDDPTWQKEVLDMFKGTIERLYEYLLSSATPERKTSFRLFKDREYTSEDLVALIVKLKDMGITIEGKREP